MSDASADVPLLEIDRATVRRGSVTVFDGLSLSIDDGEALAVLGANGAGKSTLARLLARELYPVHRDPPSVRIRGKARFAIAEYQASVGLVADHALRWLDPASLVADIVGAGSDALVAALALEDVWERPLAKLSSGQRRRVMLARALAREPDVLILDEPFSQLDPAATARLMAFLQQAVIGRMAVMLITHRLSDIPPEIGRIVGLAAGRVLFDGTKAAVLTDAALSTLYGTPVRVLSADGWHTLVPGTG